MNSAPSLETMYSIIRQAVIDMQYNPGLSINTFALVDDRPDVAGESFGYAYSDYEHGYFWSRDWVAAGHDRNKIKGSFPVLFAEQRQAVKKGKGQTRQITETIDIMILDKIKCGTCPPAIIRTGPAVYSNLRAMAEAILCEVESYVLYDRGDEYQWAAPGRAEGWPVAPVDEVDYLHEYLTIDGITFQPWGDWAGMRGLRFTLSFSSCKKSDLVFRYDTPITAFVGANNCGC